MKIDFCIFFVTSKCNSNCKFCFYKDKLNREDDLSLEEIRLISSKIGNFTTLLFSGGEPYLRQDLPEIVNIFVNQNKVKNISIPTNGINTETIVSLTAEILNNIRNKNIRFLVNVSLDALEDLDAVLRGRKDAFSTVINTIIKSGRLKRNYKNFYLTVNSVFSNESSPDFATLIKLVGEFDFVDFHNMDLIRPKYLADDFSPRVDARLLKKMHLLLAKMNEYKLRRKMAGSNNFIQWIMGLRSLVGQIGYLRYGQRIKEKFLEGRGDLFNCPAGKSICVIESNGDVKLCELRETVGNLRDNQYDLQAILNSLPARRLYNKIVKSKCNCTHTCFISEYINQGLKQQNFKIIFSIVYNYFRFALWESQSNFLVN